MRDQDNGASVDLGNYADEYLFQEVANRLKRHFRLRAGTDFRFGAFEFVFHDGRFQGIDAKSKHKLYLSPARLAVIKNQ